MHSSIETLIRFSTNKVFDFLPDRSAHEDEGFGDSTSSACWPSVICPSRSLAPVRRCSALRSTASTRASRQRLSSNFQPESLRKTGYFDVEAVQHWRKAFTQMRVVGRSASPSRWARRRPVHASFGISSSSTRALPTCRSSRDGPGRRMRSLSRYLVADKIKG